MILGGPGGDGGKFFSFTINFSPIIFRLTKVMEEGEENFKKKNSLFNYNLFKLNYPVYRGGEAAGGGDGGNSKKKKKN